VELLRQTGGRRFNLLQLAAAIGLAPMILHSLFDFAMHMPAIAIWVAALAGVMFHPGGASAEASGHRSRAAESAIMAP
jgi:hypothetical protein